MYFIRFTLFFALLSITITGCYRMPEEGEVSVVPITNNPAVTRKQSSPFMPGIEQ